MSFDARSAIRPWRSASLAALLILGACGAANGTEVSTEVSHVNHDLAAGVPDRAVGTAIGTAVGPDGLTLATVAGGAAASGSWESGIVEAPGPFTAVGLHWSAATPEGASVRLELSTLGAGGEWSAFRPVPVDEHAAPAERLADGRRNPFAGDTVGGLFHRSRGDGRAARYRVILTRAAPASDAPVVRRVTLTFIDSRKGAEPETPVRSEEAPPADPAAYPKPPVWSRAQWGARPPTCTYSYCTVTHIGIHHTAGVAEYSCNGFDECAADVRAIQAYHMDVNGWCDVGYNYLASSDGTLWEGRGGGDDVRGAHDGYNCGSMGVANMGYYHPPYSHLWTEAQIDAVAELGAWKADQKGIDPFGASWYAGYGGVMDNVYGHRDVSSTACPGDTIYPRLGELRSRIDAKITGGGGGDEIIRDNPSATTRGSWTLSSIAADRYGADYLWTSTGTADHRWCAWTVDLDQGGTYDVSFWWSEGSNRSPSVKVAVKQSALQTFQVNQQTGGGRWNSVGTFSLSPGIVRLGVSNQGETGWVVICDAVRLLRIP